jgi:hypothetical protein
MSLIFEALQKLKTQPGTGQVYVRPSPKEGRTAILHRIIYSPLLTAGLAILIVTAGFGVIYGLSVMNEQPTRPGSGEVVPVAMEVADYFASDRATVVSPSKEIIRFYPSATQTAAVPSTYRAKPTPASYGGAEGSGQADTILVSASQSQTRSKAQKALPPENPKAPSKQKEDSRQSGHDGAADERPPSSASERLLRHRINEQAEITRLVTKIQVAMARGNDPQVEQLLEELARIKGSDHAYVLKLKAYWHLRKEEYAAASDLLAKVLARDAEDLEAGINMAVVEIKTGRGQAAYKRLTVLRRVYPENVLIAELLQKLR